MSARPTNRTREEKADGFGPLPTYFELAMATAAATAHDIPDARDRRPLLSHLSMVEKAIAFAIAALAIYGAALIGEGLYVKGKADLSQFLMKRAFAAELRGEDAKPWPWADFTTEAKVSAPRPGKHAIVLSSASSEAPALGAAWLANTPQPGDDGTFVIAAHRDTHFGWLKDVQPGDDIEVTRRDGKVFTFRAGQGRVVPWDKSGIDPSAQGRRLVLATYWPFGATERGALRYIVEADLVDPQATGVVQQKNTKPLSTPR